VYLHIHTEIKCSGCTLSLELTLSHSMHLALGKY